ncbi:MAG: class I SAM-dependent methyltransferase [Bdellovibrionales bacterium]|nr:class I SAM-dependent methyltransferase [Bdellovibrionales bacterium]
MKEKKKNKKKDKKNKKDKSKDLQTFDKYHYYLRSVQSPAADVVFLRDTYKEIRKKPAKTLCEDFCGTFSISCEWTKLDKQHHAIGVDLDPEPLAYGKAHHLSQLNEEQTKRMKIIEGNVLDESLPKADIVSASNFSYYIFKQRQQLLDYFKNAKKRCKKDGLFIIDSFGGPDCMEAIEEETDYGDFKYFWDEDHFDPVTNYAQFYIHFKRKGEKKREKVFSYDWRMWSIPELRDLMLDAGFKNVHIYWEGEDENGEGNGEFKRVTEGEEVRAWVAYLVGEA